MSFRAPTGSTARVGVPCADSARATLTPLPPGSMRLGRPGGPRHGRSPVDGDRAVDARVGSQGDDRTTRPPVQQERISLAHAVVEVSVGDRTSMSANAAKPGACGRRRPWSVADHDRATGRRDHGLYLTNDSGTGRGRQPPRDRENPLVPMTARSTTRVGECVGGPRADRGAGDPRTRPPMRKSWTPGWLVSTAAAAMGS